MSSRPTSKKLAPAMTTKGPGMLESIIRFSIQQRWLILGVIVVLAALGIYSFNRLPIDAVPDITNVQVQINTEAPGFSPLEVEQRITYPVETAIAGLPGLIQRMKIRSRAPEWILRDVSRATSRRRRRTCHATQLRRQADHGMRQPVHHAGGQA